MNLNSFLKFGFFMDEDNPHLDKKFQFDINKEIYRDTDFRALIEIGTQKLQAAFQNIFPENEQHVIPLSGGLDSRAILACLLEFTEAKNIRTYTFGTPHTYDYDIGNLIAKKAGTSHIRIPLDSHTYTPEGMEKASILNEHATHLFHHPPVELIDKYFKGCTTWSGFMGGELAGAGLEKTPSKTIEQAYLKFFEMNTYVHSVDLSGVGAEKFIKYFDLPEFNDRQLTLDEQLNFWNRQKKSIYYHVKLMGRNNIYPFLENEWANFILSVPNNFRREKKVFKSILHAAFPIFKYKTKNKGGLPLYAGPLKVLKRKAKFRMRLWANNYFPRSRYGISPWTNFMNFNQQIRHDKKFRQLIYENIKDLEKRNLIDIVSLTDIYEDHIKGFDEHADALLVLTSLEYHLKSGLDPNLLNK